MKYRVSALREKFVTLIAKIIMNSIFIIITAIMIITSIFIDLLKIYVVDTEND